MMRPAKVPKTSIFAFGEKSFIKQKQPCWKAMESRSPKNHSPTFSRFTWGRWVLMMLDGKLSSISFKMTFFGLAVTMQCPFTVLETWSMRVQKIGGPISKEKSVYQPAAVSPECSMQTFNCVKPHRAVCSKYAGLALEFRTMCELPRELLLGMPIWNPTDSRVQRRVEPTLAQEDAATLQAACPPLRLKRARATEHL